MNPIPGYDGGDYADEAIRDHAGKGKRDLTRRIRYDVIERLYRSKLLTLEQRDAAVELQCDWQLAQIMPQAKSSLVKAGKSDFGLADAILDAQARHGAAMRALGQFAKLVELVALNNVQLYAAAKHLYIPRALALTYLGGHLDRLAKHYASCKS